MSSPPYIDRHSDNRSVSGATTPMPTTPTPSTQDAEYRSPSPETIDTRFPPRSTSYTPSRHLSPLRVPSSLEPIGFEDLDIHIPSFDTPEPQLDKSESVEEWGSFNPSQDQPGLPSLVADTSSFDKAPSLADRIGDAFIDQEERISHLPSRPDCYSPTHRDRRHGRHSHTHRGGHQDRHSHTHHDRRRRSHYVSPTSGRSKSPRKKDWHRPSYRTTKLPLERRISDSYRPVILPRAQRTALIGPIPRSVCHQELAAYLLRHVGMIEHLYIKNAVAKVVFGRADAILAHDKLHDVLIDNHWPLSVILPDVERGNYRFP
ncbi:hypothetical protein CspeluHIS016_0803200 [Cutaneotrichosporon spelunceum]|uniref:Uncharacterized protein n=1 Tax=Cutaneotrichosporon spelunceum TaxID=1672016 RepID=A0AAD3TZF4_9TREE|nr:hypothetical protein CspeluHIS016_0803200 [Cutaneotrichosporon spelunceum]